MAYALGFSSPPVVVEPFDGVSNFKLWLILVKEVLELDGLLETLGGKPQSPDMTDKDWESLEFKALSTIKAYLTPSVQLSVLNEKSPKALLKKLETDYASNTLRNKLFRKKKLYQLRMEEDTDIQDHVTLFFKLLAELENNGVKVEEEDKFVALLTSLPDSYENLATYVLSGKKKVNLEDMIVILVGNDVFKKMGNPGIEYSHMKCLYCHKKGHIQSNCEQKKRDMNPDGVDPLDQEWIFGTVASFHICKHRGWFDNYEPCGGYISSVYTGEKSQIVGIGDVKVRMYDGKIMTLTGVRHVPKSVTSIIAVMRLCSLGYGCRFSGGSATVTTKDGKVVMEGEMMPIGLYNLKGKQMN